MRDYSMEIGRGEGGCVCKCVMWSLLMSLQGGLETAQMFGADFFFFFWAEKPSRAILCTLTKHCALTS